MVKKSKIPISIKIDSFSPKERGATEGLDMDLIRKWRSASDKKD
jgi:hypothetical protein